MVGGGGFSASLKGRLESSGLFFEDMEAAKVVWPRKGRVGQTNIRIPSLF